MPENETSLTTTTFQAARKFWRTSLARGALFLVVGVVMFLWNDAALDVLAWLLAGVLVLQAGILFIETQRMKGAGQDGTTWRLILAVIAVAAAIAVLVWPNRSVTIVLRIVAVWALVAGGINLARALGAYRARTPSWSWEFAIALLWIVFGGLVLVKPLDDVNAVAAVLSVYLVVTGVVLLVSGFALSVAAKDDKAAAAGVVAPGAATAQPGTAPSPGAPSTPSDDRPVPPATA
jgi:uncharacterized membrane protein HdeD (DUF308 family)